MRGLVFLLLLLACTVVQSAELAIVLADETALRPAPKSAGRPLVMLMQGETLEVRGERLDYLQVWDHRRERGGYVRAAQVRRLSLEPEAAPELLTLVRFLRAIPGSEALGIGLAAAYIEAAPPAALNGAQGVEVMDAIGAMAERLARRSSPHTLVASSYGLKFVSVEQSGKVRICYDGAVFRRVLALHADAETRARAALALTSAECGQADAEVLDSVSEQELPPYLRNRVLMRRAIVWAGIAYQRARADGDAKAAAARAATALAAVEKGELADADRAAYDEAALRVQVSRWALAADRKEQDEDNAKERRPSARPATLQVFTVPGRPGETCVVLVDAKNTPLVRQCTYGHVWTTSASPNRDATALALSVQPTEGWRELWVFRKAKGGWNVRVLPPAATSPGVGYTELAGWTPGKVRVVRVAVVDGRLRKSVQLVRL